MILILSLTNEVASVIDSITGTLWTIMIIVSVITVIANFLRKTSLGNKLISTALILIANYLSLQISGNYFLGLNSSADKSGLGGIVDFAIVLLYGGVLWLSSIGTLTGATFFALSEEDDFYYFKSVGCIIGGYLIAIFCGLM